MLITQYEWEQLQREYTFTTDARVPQEYPLPANFYYMINQTGWLRDQSVPLSGPLNAQEWAYLQGRDLSTSTIYASFRLNEGKMKLWPETNNLASQTISYEYMSNGWVQPSGVTDPDGYTNKVTTGSDLILYPNPLMVLFLKARYLATKGMATGDANAEFSNQFMALTGVNKSSPTLNVSGNIDAGIPYLNSWMNAPHTGFGS